MKNTYSFFIGLICGIMLFFYTTNPQEPTQIIVYAAPDTTQLTVITEEDYKQIQCLAKNIVFEAWDQPQEGKIAVSQVVMNRTKDPKFPKTPCGVILQKNKKGCQFSWFCKGKWHVKNKEIQIESLHIAELVYLNKVPDNTNGSLFYHATSCRPFWRKHFEITKIIGDHIFYKKREQDNADNNA